jgi:hypothetical protein
MEKINEQIHMLISFLKIFNSKMLWNSLIKIKQQRGKRFLNVLLQMEFLFKNGFLQSIVG